MIPSVGVITGEISYSRAAEGTWGPFWSRCLKVIRWGFQDPEIRL